ncbi:hypothetical protein PAT3040_04135 [Paenibacillus agaridevorans]|uniref:Uncharacterized protein n=1 Tax=Paenibacillus agaridevorans TaxID=171404 RepID=A0A2R5EUZ8_9BACL|nr:hypothetical protein [Paenibacillus agaridevorans]GBG09489.1 hypothetical protein PAT3040_04135 [Paenibacillus agaridevorans]
MTKRENCFVPVKSWFETPAQRTERERRLQNRSAPLIKKWERTMTEDEYLQAVREGRSRADIVLKHFNNDLSELKKQLKDWGITEEGAVRMAQAKVEITVTKEEYLQRRLNGEKRSSILRSLGLAGPKGYEFLKEWGIREIDAEERELELLSPNKPESEVDKRVAEQIEQKTEARGLIAFNEQQEAEPAGTDILEREQELANLQAATALWKNEAERKDEYIKDLETELKHTRDEVDRVKRLTGINGARIQELESERNLLLQTIEQAAGEDAGFIALRIPILSVAIANVERARIYEAVEALSSDVEAAEIDRERVMTELFDLLQRTVNFITADLAELHPGRDVSGFVREFFAFYNDRHSGLVIDTRQAS